MKLVPLLNRGYRRAKESYDQWRYGRIDSSAPIGRQGEQAAARLLRKKGLVIVAQSESDRAGEIDLIAADRKTRAMIFVEVKTLRTTRPGHPADRVDENKQRRITHAAIRYLKRRNLLGIPSRFDVVAIWWPDGNPQPTAIEHYEHAFEATGGASFWA
ncbi:MAG: YraN family protein [Planctomycetota bacterium]